MRSLLLLAPLALTGCADDPCRGADGPRVYVYGAADAHRLEGSDPTAFGSIAEAVAASDPGGAVCVSGGTWREVLDLKTQGLQLLGAGPGETVLESPESAPDAALVTLDAADLLVRGFTLRGGPVGVAVARGASARLESLSIEDNETGLSATGPAALSLEEVDLVRNRELGASISAGDWDALVSIRGGRISGNGDRSRSRVGGLRSSLDVLMEDVQVRDNAGRGVADLEIDGHLEAWGLTVERPTEALAIVPRIRVTDGLELLDSQLHLDGSPGLEVSCADGRVRLENVIITDAQGLSGDQLSLTDCQGTIYQSTFADLGGGQSAAIAMAGGGSLTIANTALVGFDQGIRESRFTGHWRGRALFEGSVTQAQLLSPLSPEPDLRPQSDSPLLDSGRELGVATDIHGAARPRGAGPDIGAYEY